MAEGSMSLSNDRVEPAANRINLHRHLSREQIHEVRQRSTWRGIGMIVHCWAMIAAAMALVAWMPNPVTILLAIAVIGSRQLGLAILMHEGAHGGLAVSGKTNLWLSQWLCAYPVLTDTLAYRGYHMEHHAHAQTASDPDIGLSAPFPTTRASLVRKIVRDLTGQTGFKQRRAQFVAALGRPGTPIAARVRLFAAKLGRPLAFNLGLFTALVALGYWWLYPVLWVLPLLTWYQLVTRIRNIAEHAVLPEGDPWRIARTTHAGVVMRTFLAPYWVNYHAEHHLMLYVPCYRLKRLHQRLIENGAGHRLETQPGYADMLRLASAR